MNDNIIETSKFCQDCQSFNTIKHNEKWITIKCGCGVTKYEKFGIVKKYPVAEFIKKKNVS